MFIYHFNRMIRSRILWLIFAIVVGATFLALPSCFSGDSSGREYAGKLGRTKISQDEYNAASVFVRRVMDTSTLTPAATETQIWAHIAAVSTAEKMGITASDDEVADWLTKFNDFLDENGNFNYDLYARTVSQSFGSPEGCEAFLRKQIIISKLQMAVTAGNVASPMEVEDEVSAMTDSVTFQYATVSNSFAAAELEVTDDDMLAYYEKSKTTFAEPDRVSVRFAKVPVTNFLAFAVVDEGDIVDEYDANTSKYSRQGTNGVEVIPFEEVRDSIYHKLALEEAITIAETNLNSFIDTIAMDEKFVEDCKKGDGEKARSEIYGKFSLPAVPGAQAVTNEAIEAILADSVGVFNLHCGMKHYEMADTQMFADNVSFLPGVEWDAVKDFRETAHDLVLENPEGRYGVASGKEYVYIIRLTAKDPAHTPEFESLKDRIKPLCLGEKRQEEFERSSKAVADAIKVAMKDSKDAKAFEAAAKAQSLNVSTSITFSAQSVSATAFDNARAIAPEVSRLGVNEVSEPISVYNGAVIAFVSERTPSDPLTVQTQRDQIRSMMSRIYADAAFSDWLISNLESIGFSSSRIDLLKAADAEAAEDE